MAWTYCSCGQGLDEPTVRQVLMDEYRCPVCGEEADTHTSQAEIILQLVERVEQLEAKLAELKGA